MSGLFAECVKYVGAVHRCRALAGSTTLHTRGRAPGPTRRSGGVLMMELERVPIGREAEAEIVTGTSPFF